MVDLSRVNRRELWILAGLVVATVVGVTIALTVTGKGIPGITGPVAQETQDPVTLTEIPVATKVAKVAGKLPARAREQIQREVDVLLTRYVAEAFLGDYPSKDFSGTWGAFTEGITPAAKQDSDLLTGERWTGETVSVTPGKLVARVAVFADHKKPIGATASVRFEFLPVADTTTPPPVTLTGRFILTLVAGEWRIFGYDVAAPAATGTGAGQ